ncbi:hypothetical protein Y032_0002g620 [Ancylostoma ceylanicum]|uniref:Uncharacterized protein n=1 Tax=Ancylostoma ceylanicum TaxID=53326 RepID=A0A016W1J4_9BILA|nr:hypothetical protein Y032_0002g620 [Ancylostoma ceylanicum]
MMIDWPFSMINTCTCNFLCSIFFSIIGTYVILCSVVFRNTSWNYDENLIAKKEDIDNQLRLYSSEVEKEKAKFVDLLTATVFSKFLHP